MLALILGGNGFIGSHLVDQLLDSGSKVRVFDRGPEKFRSPRPGVEYFQGEFDNISKLTEALHAVDVVYHLISTTVPSTSNIDPLADIQGNLINTVVLLDLMRALNIPKIVYLSSGGTVYGIPSLIPTPESHSTKPINSYGIVKVAIENYLHMYQHLYSVDYVSLRASNPYGPRQGHSGLQGVIGTYLNNLVDNKPVTVWGDGTVIRDFIYIEDLAELCLLAGQSNATGVYNAGSGVGTSIADVIGILSEVTGIAIKPEFSPSRSIDVPAAVLDISNTERTFQWMPSVSIRDGIDLTWKRHGIHRVSLAA